MFRDAAWYRFGGAEIADRGLAVGMLDKFFDALLAASGQT
jgi:hypothetical protein